VSCRRVVSPDLAFAVFCVLFYVVVPDIKFSKIFDKKYKSFEKPSKKNSKS
jgi:hypothetical protein